MKNPTPRHSRRRIERIKVDWPVRLQTQEGQALDGRVVDFSVSGLRVRVEPEPPCGTVVLTEVAGAADRPAFALLARVVRRSDDGIGLNFLGVAGRDFRGLGAGHVPERRRAPRVSVDVIATLRRAEHWVQTVTVHDLSQFAARVTSAIDLPGEVPVVLTLPLDPDEPPLEMLAVVGRRDPRGTVLLFVSIAETALIRLGGFVARAVGAGAAATDRVAAGAGQAGSSVWRASAAARMRSQL